MTKQLTARNAITIYYEAQKIKQKGAIEYKRYLRRVVEDYGIEKNDVFQIANGNNILQIVAKYEVAE